MSKFRDFQNSVRLSDQMMEMYEAEFQRLLSSPECMVLYQPVLSLGTGELYGYDVITSLSPESVFESPKDLWLFADLQVKRFALETSILEHVLMKFESLPRDMALIVKVHARSIHNIESSLPDLNDMLLNGRVSPRQIIFDVQSGPIDDYVGLAHQVNAIRQSGFKFAVNSIWNNHPWAHSVAAIRPDYIRANAFITQNVSHDRTKIMTLETLVEMSRKWNCRVLVDGLDHDEDLNMVLRLGIQFGTGSLLGKPEPNIGEAFSGQETIQSLRVHSGPSSDLILPLEKIVRPVKTLHGSTLVEDVVRYFQATYMETGVVIMRGDNLIGFVMKERLFQQLASKFGYALYGNKRISRLMETDPLILEIDTPLETVSRLAMARDQEHVYDQVIITRLGQLVGVVTVQDILNSVTSAQIELARDANPLTGLPGNRRIEQEIAMRVRSQNAFIIIYIDLDYFKWFNDRYGFHRGDTIIGFTANVLRDSAENFGRPGDFLGHIGGDDFIVITEAENIDLMCDAIIARFEREIPPYYPDYEQYAGVFEVTNRVGQTGISTGLSISLSVLECRDVEWSEVALESISAKAGELKKRAKECAGSVYVRDTLAGHHHPG